MIWVKICGNTTLEDAQVAVLTQYDERQPRCWPSHVATGTPTTLATGSPMSTSAILPI